MIENLVNKARAENLLISVKGGHVTRGVLNINHGVVFIKWGPGGGGQGSWCIISMKVKLRNASKV